MKYWFYIGYAHRSIVWKYVFAHVLSKNENLSIMLGTGYFQWWKSQKLIPSKKNQSVLIEKITSRKTQKNSQSSIGSRRSPIVHQIQNQECMQMMLIYYIDVSVFHVGFFQNRYLSNINHFLPANRLILYMTKTELKLICNNWTVYPLPQFGN